MDHGEIPTIDATPRSADLFAGIPSMYAFDNERPAALRVASRGIQYGRLVWPHTTLENRMRGKVLNSASAALMSSGHGLAGSIVRSSRLSDRPLERELYL